MNDRHRRVLEGIALTLGVSCPFLVGSVIEHQHSRARSLRREASEQAPHSHAARQLRSRFAGIRIGMEEREVASLLGAASGADWIEPTHAETWFNEAGSVSHRSWAPPSKVYWLLTAVNARSRWWTSHRSQAFVLFDHRKRVEGKMWLEDRREE